MQDDEDEERARARDMQTVRGGDAPGVIWAAIIALIALAAALADYFLFN